MREASTKPSAATVLPAPVACSNQKRLAALGSSGCSASWSSSSSPDSAAPVQRLLVLVLLVLLLAGDPDGGERGDVVGGDRAVGRARCRCAGPRRAARSACPTARRPGGRRARCRRPACGSSSPSSRSRPSRSENRRRHSTEGCFEAGVELGQRGVERHAPGRARRERDRGILALGHEGLAGERLGPLEVGGSGSVRGLIGHWRGFSQGRQKAIGVENESRRHGARAPRRLTGSVAPSGCRCGLPPRIRRPRVAHY